MHAQRKNQTGKEDREAEEQSSNGTNGRRDWRREAKNEDTLL